MALPGRHVISLERIADRWRVDVARVHELVLTARLPRAFLVAGPARITLGSRPGTMIYDAATHLDTTRAHLLVTTASAAPDFFIWKLAQVRRIYAFDENSQSGRLSLFQYQEHEQLHGLGWIVRFDPNRTTIEGTDSILVDIRDLIEHERLWNIGPASQKQQLDSRRLRDTRKQRCRVAAEIVWRNDPQATLAQVFRHPWVQEVACEGKPPTEKRFREWVKDLNPDRRPGRRPSARKRMKPDG